MTGNLCSGFCSARVPSCRKTSPRIVMGFLSYTYSNFWNLSPGFFSYTFIPWSNMNKNTNEEFQLPIIAAVWPFYVEIQRNDGCSSSLEPWRTPAASTAGGILIWVSVSVFLFVLSHPMPFTHQQVHGFQLMCESLIKHVYMFLT